MVESGDRVLRSGPHRISLWTPSEAVSWILESTRRRDEGCRQVMASGFHGLWAVASDDRIARELAGVDLWVPDGIAPVFLARALGAKDVHRIPGPELFAAVLAEASARGGLKHFLYGDTEETLASLKSHIEARYPNNVVVGTHSPPFSPEVGPAPPDVLEQINDSGADVLWVGLGTPKQDLWIARNKASLRVPVAVAVGAAFRFETGGLRRAPDWMGRHGLEWVFRLVEEPRRLWRRVLLDGPRFVWWAVTSLVTGRITLEETRSEGL